MSIANMIAKTATWKSFNEKRNPNLKLPVSGMMIQTTLNRKAAK